MIDRVLPYTADEVVRLLDESFPERSPDPSMTDREIMYEAGKRSVVRYLLELQQRRDQPQDDE